MLSRFQTFDWLPIETIIITREIRPFLPNFSVRRDDNRRSNLTGHITRQRIRYCAINYTLADGLVQNQTALVTEAEKKAGDDLVFFKHRLNATEIITAVTRSLVYGQCVPRPIWIVLIASWSLRDIFCWWVFRGNR